MGINADGKDFWSGCFVGGTFPDEIEGGFGVDHKACLGRAARAAGVSPIFHQQNVEATFGEDVSLFLLEDRGITVTMQNQNPRFCIFSSSFKGKKCFAVLCGYGNALETADAKL